MNGHAGERRRVVGVDDLHPVREVAAHLLHLGANAAYGIECVGPGDLTDGESCGGQAVIGRIDVVGLGAHLDAGNVAQTHDGAIGTGADRNGSKLLRRLEQVLYDDGRVEPLA